MGDIQKETLKRISIRGRVAISIDILSEMLKGSGIESQFIFMTLQGFTISNSLDDWLVRAKKITPDFFLKSNFSQLEEIMNIDEYNQLKQYYFSLEENIRLAIQRSIWIGISNIYSSTGEFSETSLNYLLDVIEIAKDVNIELPEFENYIAYSFLEAGGWGNPFEYPDKRDT